MAEAAPFSAGSQTLVKLYRSSLGKKIVTGLTGLGLATFVLVHMIGNLLMFVSRDAYNLYAYRLESLSPLLYAIETLLLGILLLHGFTGLQIFISRLKARSQPYQTYVSAGNPSYQSVSSRTMVLTGVMLAGFLIAHLMTFKFGVRYTTAVNGIAMRDLARLVVEKFQDPFYTVGYVGLMSLLGLHLRHGLWSALQSLGLLDRRWRPWAFSLGTLLAAAIALGFMAMPVAICWGWIS